MRDWEWSRPPVLTYYPGNYVVHCNAKNGMGRLWSPGQWSRSKGSLHDSLVGCLADEKMQRTTRALPPANYPFYRAGRLRTNPRLKPGLAYRDKRSRSSIDQRAVRRVDSTGILNDSVAAQPTAWMLAPRFTSRWIEAKHFFFSRRYST